MNTCFYIVLISILIAGVSTIVVYIKKAHKNVKLLIIKTRNEIYKAKHDYAQIESCKENILQKSNRIINRYQHKKIFSSLLSQIKQILEFRDSNVLLKRYISDKDYKGLTLINTLEKKGNEQWSKPEKNEYLQLSKQFLAQEQAIVNKFLSEIKNMQEFLASQIQYSNSDLSIIDSIETFCIKNINEERYKSYKQDLISLSGKAKSARLEIAKRNQQIELKRQKTELQKEINSYNELIKNQDIDNADTKERKIEEIISIIDCPEQKTAFEKIKLNYYNQKKQGISVFEEECYVNYNIMTDYSLDSYVLSRFPTKGTIVWPHRRGLIARRGYTEAIFESALKKHFKNQIDIFGDINLLPQSGYRPYEPDIAIVDIKSGWNIRMDIEIDEPYDAITRKPTHYKGCGDKYRDENLNNLGWIVIRFSEKQIYNQQNNCIAYIARLINHINPMFSIPAELVYINDPNSDSRWTQLEAQNMAIDNVRETYLNHTFGETANSVYIPTEINLTDFEEKMRSKVKQTIRINNFVKKKTEINGKFVLDNNLSYNIKNKFTQDKEIHFDPDKHLYTCNGIIFKAVSNLISELFPIFNSDYWAPRKATEKGITTAQILEEWECKGAKSREVGTFLHKQIENYFIGRVVEKDYHFTYNGNYVKDNENININSDYQYFMDFLHDNPLRPFRTEWRICDKSNQIAGTIDCICKNGDKFNIYDWKRSEKLYQTNNYQNGLGKLNNLQDTSLNHYFLQQNFYKFILEHNYGLSINKMYLVYLHKCYDEYKIKEVPDMKHEIDYILRWMND